MAFQIQPGRSLQGEIRRIAQEQINKAICELQDKHLSRATRVHQSRKRCKKLRSLLRLVRAQSPHQYAKEDAAIRDTARGLSETRDARVLLDTYDRVMEHFHGQVKRKAFASIRRRLTWQRKQLLRQQGDAQQPLVIARKRLLKANGRIDDWQLTDKGFAALADGLANTYRRGRKGMKAAYESGHAEDFHEWRKYSKHHWHHCLLLEAAWPQAMQARAKEADRLVELLGAAHDLDVLCQLLAENPHDYGKKKAVSAFIALANQRSHELKQASRPVGKRLYAESPGKFLARLRAYWKAT